MKPMAACLLGARGVLPLAALSALMAVAPATRALPASPAQVAPAPSALSAALAFEEEVLPGSGSTRLLLRDGRFVEGRLLALEDGNLLLAGGAGGEAPIKVPLADLVRMAQGRSAAGGPASGTGAGTAAPDILDLAGGAAAARGAPEAHTGGGDRLVGRLLGGNTYGVRFQLSGALPFDVPFESIDRLLPHASGPVDRLTLLPGAEADDRLWRRGADGTPDSLTGVVQSVGDGKVVFESALGTLDFPLADVIALIFAAEGRATDPLPGTAVMVRLRDGSRLDAGLLEWRDGRCVLATQFSPRLELPTDAVASLVRHDDSITLLADLMPTRVEEWPSFGTPADFLFPWRKDLSVSGQLLTVGGQSRPTGLGVHSNSRLTFTVPPGATTLFVTAGLCDEVADLPALGTVNFAVRVQGVLVAATGLVREGGAAQTLRLDGLRGGETLELFTGDGGDDDAGDRAAWADGVFMRAGN